MAMCAWRSDVELLPEAIGSLMQRQIPAYWRASMGSPVPGSLVEHNLIGTINLLEYCREVNAGLILLSSSRVYSIPPLGELPVQVEAAKRFIWTRRRLFCAGVSAGRHFRTVFDRAPVSLYGATKRASELLALEYGATFGFPVWIDRCGVLAGAGQFGTAEQGIFSYWLHAHAARLPLRYIGFGGLGYQVRDAFHPVDLADAVTDPDTARSRPGLSYFQCGRRNGQCDVAGRVDGLVRRRFGAHAPRPIYGRGPSTSHGLSWMQRSPKLSSAGKSAGLCQSILDEIARHVGIIPTGYGTAL